MAKKLLSIIEFILFIPVRILAIGIWLYLAILALLAFPFKAVQFKTKSIWKAYISARKQTWEYFINA